MIFPRDATFLQRPEVDLILVLNKLLEKAGVLAYTWFSKVEYSQFRAILELLIEKLNIENLLRDD